MSDKKKVVLRDVLSEEFTISLPNTITDELVDAVVELRSAYNTLKNFVTKEIAELDARVEAIEKAEANNEVNVSSNETV